MAIDNLNRLYTFRCPECLNEFTYDEPGEPMCTGPGEVDQHEPKVMRRIRVKDKDKVKEVSAAEGEARAKGALLTAETLVGMKARVKGRLWKPKDGINPWTGEEMTDD
jgi:hypothetical protein